MKERLYVTKIKEGCQILTIMIVADTKEKATALFHEAYGSEVEYATHSANAIKQVPGFRVEHSEEKIIPIFID